MLRHTENLGVYRINTVAQLDELPSQVVHMQKQLEKLAWEQWKRMEPGMIVTCDMWGQPVALSYEVARHLAACYAMEKA